MKAYVDRDTCIGCGACEGTCPEVFKLDDESKSVPIKDEIPEKLLDLAKEAEEGCPVDAITVE